MPIYSTMGTGAREPEASEPEYKPKPRVEPEEPPVVPALVLYDASCPSWGHAGLSVCEGRLIPDSSDKFEQERCASALRLIDFYRRTGRIRIHRGLFHTDEDAERFITVCMMRVSDVKTGISLSHSGHGELIFRKRISLEGALDGKRARELFRAAGYETPFPFSEYVVGSYRSRRTRAT